MNAPAIKTAIMLIALALLALRSCAGDALTIGPTKIPFYTGNLSVTRFMMEMGTSKGPQGPHDWASREHIVQLKRISCFADCDYQSWAVAEPEKGEWDFGVYTKNADALRAAGLKYIVFAWVHFPPKWFLESKDFIPYVCAEHGEKLMQLSPWAPTVWDVYRRFYKAQHQAMGDKIDWIRIATPSDYGEIGYPAAMTSWLVPQKHAHAGYWCGGPYARADFRAEMRRKFRSLGNLNRRWGTGFQAWEDVALPDLVDERAARVARESSKPTDRRRWLDFIEWYYDVWVRFTPKLAEVVREFYPETPMIVSVGYASECTAYGNDYTAIPKMAKHTGLALQTPGNVPYYALKRVSTACHHYGCPYYTEPPGDVPPDAEIARVFSDVSNGVQVYFEYPNNLDRARAKLRVYKDHMTGMRSVVDLAIFNASIEQRLNGSGAGFPMDAYLLGEHGRERFDYDVVDEHLIRDGALSPYRVLVYVQGRVTEEFSLKKIAQWVRSGGTLVTCDLGDVETVDGDKTIWRSLVKPDGPDARRVGKGLVIRLPAKPYERDKLIEGVVRAAYHLSEHGGGFRNAPLIDDAADGLAATLFPDRILLFNGGDKEITKHVRLRPEDWAGRERKPERMEFDVTVGPHSIEAIMLSEQSGQPR